MCSQNTEKKCQGAYFSYHNSILFLRFARDQISWCSWNVYQPIHSTGNINRVSICNMRWLIYHDTDADPGMVPPPTPGFWIKIGNFNYITHKNFIQTLFSMNILFSTLTTKHRVSVNRNKIIPIPHEIDSAPAFEIPGFATGYCRLD